MSLNNYPYPVLMQDAEGEINDCITKTREPEVIEDLETGDISYKVTAEFIFDDDYIKHLIADGKAKYCYVVKCSQTSFSCSDMFDTSICQFDISRFDVREKVIIEYYVVLTDTIRYNNPNMHPDYEGLEIEMTPGDILVDFGETTFNADVQFNKYASSEGIFSIVKSETAEHVEIDTTNSKKIKITLPKEFFEQYMEHKRSKTHLFDTALAMPVLIQALNTIDFDDVENDNRIWVQSIMETIKLNDKCREIEISNDCKYRIPELAQALFENPYHRFIEEFKN